MNLCVTPGAETESPISLLLIASQASVLCEVVSHLELVLWRQKPTNRIREAVGQEPRMKNKRIWFGGFIDSANATILHLAALMSFDRGRHVHASLGWNFRKVFAMVAVLT